MLQEWWGETSPWRGWNRMAGVGWTKRESDGLRDTGWQQGPGSVTRTTVSCRVNSVSRAVVVDTVWEPDDKVDKSLWGSHRCRSQDGCLQVLMLWVSDYDWWKTSNRFNTNSNQQSCAPDTAHPHSAETLNLYRLLVNPKKQLNGNYHSVELYSLNWSPKDS